jgi:predicted TIM-barrel fold metal-dependent hydrolase
MEKVLGIGGLFFRARDSKALAQWYDERTLRGSVARNKQMKHVVIAVAIVLGPIVVTAQPPPLPIIDAHAHASTARSQGPPPLGMCSPVDIIRDAAVPWGAAFMAILKKPPCSNPIWSPMTDDALMNETLTIMRRRNIIGIVSGSLPLVQQWRKQAPERVIPGLQFEIQPGSLSPDAIGKLHADGDIAVLGEVTNQYAGILPADPAFEPYLAMAEQRELPVALHLGTGPPGAPYLAWPKYRASMHSPLLIEDVLVRHPRLRIYLMHAGWPMIDDLLAVMWTHPQVYVDTGIISYALPRAEFHNFIRRIVEAGFGKRVMFGSDQMVWPGAMERAIESITSAPFLSEAQKRDILYNNAARFFRFNEAEIAKHHGR